MRLATALLYVVCVADGFAQNSGTLDAIRYPPLAATARVKGDVLIAGGNVVAGSPLLAQTALRGVLNIRAPGANILFHFILSDIVLSTRTETIKKGDAFDRFFLRLLRIPDVKKIEIRECTEGPNARANRIDSTKDPIEVWVYGKEPCPTVTGTLERS
jgi:hypothetical protein